jgi:hypothetical protein
MLPQQKLIFKSMKPEKKLDVALHLIFSSKELKKAELRTRHPEWNEDRIEQRVREIFLYARS